MKTLSIINRSMIIKSNTIFFIYTIVINDSKVFINKRESLRYLGLFSLVQKEAKRQGKRVALIRDRLYRENELYEPAEEIDEAGDFDTPLQPHNVWSTPRNSGDSIEVYESSHNGSFPSRFVTKPMHISEINTEVNSNFFV
jgi:hypothetical protein